MAPLPLLARADNNDHLFSHCLQLGRVRYAVGGSVSELGRMEATEALAPEMQARMSDAIERDRTALHLQWKPQTFFDEPQSEHKRRRWDHLVLVTSQHLLAVHHVNASRIAELMHLTRAVRKLPPTNGSGPRQAAVARHAAHSLGHGDTVS